ncbi:M4 family metallopeptidase [Chryseolinea serpens]|nr:M4 family metallopeptidase [Chryseolinea serpens]
MHRLLLVIFICFLSVGQSMAQKSARTTPASLGVSNTGTGTAYYGGRNEPPRAMVFKTGTVTASSFLANINQYFNIPAEFTFVEAESNTDDLGMRHRLLQQYYKGLLVEGMGYRLHEKGGFVTSVNGKAVRNMNPDMNISLNEAQAFQLATRYLQTKDTTVRRGQKLIVSKDFTLAPESFAIAFQFDIDVSLIERWRISIDARNGQVLNKVSLVNACREDTPPEPPLPYITGTGMTNYYGLKPIRIESTGSGSQMVGQTAHGGIIGTYDFGNRSLLILQLGIPFNPPVFTSSGTVYNDYYSQPAVSAQWAAEQAYEYYYTKHNRNSFDNLGGAIKSYVHVDVGWDNAMWTGSLLVLGDGSNNNPLVELDVVSHELTHGVTQYEAKLQYKNESGALNESFSDILGKAVEFNVLGGAATWQIGRHFRDGGIRDMSNPNVKSQPDTYFGDMWQTGADDYGGVHTNSGVQNFWFYLLSKGGSGVNDRQVNYSVNAIGMDAAVKITYRNLTEYLAPQSDYLDSRIGSLLAATDLYGNNSTIYQEVANAWDAVGVIDEPTVTSLGVYDITATTVKINGSMIPRSNVATYHFEYGTTPAYGSSTAEYPYTNKVEGVITGLQSETKYYLKLVATNENGVSSATTEFTTISLAPLVKLLRRVDMTETTATWYGQINPNSLPTSFHFEYGLTPAFGLVTPPTSLPGATEFLDVSAALTGLQPRQTYYYRLVATNGSATSKSESASFFTGVRPVILSYTPTTAPIGTEVTITGQNFNVTPEKNVVSFGATRGAVLSSSSTEIKVKVPAGASLGPISVWDAESGLSAESVKEFVPTFSGEFKKGDLQLKIGSTDYMYQTLVQDMDGDNRPDIVVRHYLGFSVFQNVNQGGDITDASFVRNTFNSVDTPQKLFLIDFDGNGLKDIVGKYQDGVRVYPNLSVPGYIFFGPPVSLSVGTSWNLAFNDLDQDGRVDIAVAENVAGIATVKIFRNQNPKGLVLSENFVNQFSKSLAYPVNDLYSEDLNNDGKPELWADASNKIFIPILVNSSQPGVFAFDEYTVQDAMITYPKYVSQDLNLDGWKDLVAYSPYQGVNLAILENKKTAPGVTVGTMTSALTGYEASVVQPADLNGDGAVDLLVGLENGKFSFLKNKGAANTPISDASFDKSLEFGVLNDAVESIPNMTINDLNGDGRPEVINIISYHQFPHEGYLMEIWQNSPNNCIDPSQVSVSVSSYVATITLPPNTTLDQFEIDYSYEGTYWGRVSSTRLTNLSYGHTYQLRARAKCGLGFTDYYYINFTTECIYTDGFSIASIGIDNATLDESAGLYYFEMAYSLAGKNEWINQYGSQIKNLLPGTTYDLRYRGQCNPPSNYKYKQFTTQCPKLATLTVTPSSYNSANVRWTSNYPGNAVLEYSADKVTWTSIGADLTLHALVLGKQYFVRGSMACTNLTSDFMNASFTMPCAKISRLSVDAVTPFSAKVNWVDESVADSYTVAYSVTGGAVTTVTTSATSFILEGLAPGTPYTVTVTPKCMATENPSSTSFSTFCYVPFDLSADAITHTTAELSWSDNFDGYPYVIDYSISGSKVWQTIETASTNLSLTGLRPGAEYEVRVHIHCSSETLAFASLRFKTELYDETTYFPNPTDGEVTIHPSKNLIGNRFIICDNVGKVVANGELPDYTIDLSILAPGIYTLKIEGENLLKIVKR